MVLPLPAAPVITPFLFGKLPTHGDFVSRGLSDAAREAWDGQASALLECARSALGDGFEEAHERAPPWRFVCGPSSLGDDWRAGALASSVDSAGRRFLIVIGVDGVSPSQASAGRYAAEACEGVIYSAFAEALDADGALSLLQAVAPPLPDAPGSEPDSSIWWIVSERGATVDHVVSAELPSDLLLRAATSNESLAESAQ